MSESPSTANNKLNMNSSNSNKESGSSHSNKKPKSDWLIPAIGTIYSHHRLHELAKLLMHRVNVVLALCDAAPSTEADELAEFILGIYQLHNRTNLLLERIIYYECSRVEMYSEIFRNNNICTKIMRNRMRSCGKDYLFTIIGPSITEIINSNDSYEIDPTRLESGVNTSIEQIVLTNQTRLIHISRKLLNAVLESGDSFPAELKTICSMLLYYAKEAFPSDTDMGLVCGFFFLRFISPFIIAPGAYQFLKPGVTPSKQATRGLILVSKTVQNIANNITFGSKESFMIPLNSVVEEYSVRVQDFIKQMIESRPSNVIEPAHPSIGEEDKYLPELHIYISANRNKIGKILSQRYDGGFFPEEGIDKVEVVSKIKSRATGGTGLSAASAVVGPISGSQLSNNSPTSVNTPSTSTGTAQDDSSNNEGSTSSDIQQLAQVLLNLGPPSAPMSASGNAKERIYSEELNDSGEKEIERNKIFQEIFHLETSDTIMAEWSCSLDGQIPVAGKLYLSEHYLCFYASVFGFTTKELLPLWTVASIEKEPSVSNSIEISVGFQTYVLLNLSKVHKTYDAVRRQWKIRKGKPVQTSLPNGNSNSGSNSSGSGGGNTSGGNTSTTGLAGGNSGGGIGSGGADDKEKGLLTAKDWQLFQQTAKQVTYQKNQSVLKQGQRSHSLYQIARGDVRVEIDLPGGGTKVLKRIPAGEMFGEVSFLQAEEDPELAVASASIIAENEVDMYIIDHKSIATLIRKDPNLAARFYKWLAITLGRRMRANTGSKPSSSFSSSATTSPTSPTTTTTMAAAAVAAAASLSSASSPSMASSTAAGATASSSTSTTAQQQQQQQQQQQKKEVINEVTISDSKYHKLFDINDPKQVVLFQQSVSLQKALPVHGTLYVSVGYVAFHARVLGVSIRELIPMSGITAIFQQQATIEFEVSSNKGDKGEKMVLFTFSNEVVASQLLQDITNLWNNYKKNSKERDKELASAVGSFASSSARPRFKSNAYPPSALSGGFNNNNNNNSQMSPTRERMYSVGIFAPSGSDSSHNNNNNNGSNNSNNNSNAVDTVGDMLTESDIKTFLEVAKLVKKKKDEMILSQGQPNNCLFQISRGAVRVEVNGKPIGRIMKPDEFFGEMAYLEGGVASASCVSDVEGTEVYIIDGSVVNRLLAAQPGLAGRLYKVLASILAQRLRN